MIIAQDLGGKSINANLDLIFSSEKVRGIVKSQFSFCKLFENAPRYKVFSAHFLRASGHARPVTGRICKLCFCDFNLAHRCLFPASIAPPTTCVSDVPASTRTFLAEKISRPPNRF